MSFIEIAQQFLVNPGNLKKHKKLVLMQETVKFLLENAVGADHAISTDNIIRHLNSKGYKIKKEDWQINVLGPLRDNGIFIGSRRGGHKSGMYIIANKQDALQTHGSIYDRVFIERQRLLKLEKLMDELKWEYD